jgi:hypothetical protein
MVGALDRDAFTARQYHALQRVRDFSVESGGGKFKVLHQAYRGICTKLIQVMK